MKAFSLRVSAVRLAAQLLSVVLLFVLVAQPVQTLAEENAGSTGSRAADKQKKSAKNKPARAKASAGKSARSKVGSASATDDPPAGKKKVKKKGADARAATDDTQSAKATGKKTKKSRKPASRHAQVSKAARAAQTTAIRKAFTASSELRPMAQQLANLRTPEAYAGVTAYAHSHSGDAAAAAYLALGHAYLLDKRYGDAGAALRQSKKAGGQLDDYADFLAAQAAHQAGDNALAESELKGFIDRYPDSIFDAQAPELEAAVLLVLNNPTAAQSVLAAAQGLAAEDRPGFQLAQANVALALGQRSTAERIFRQLLVGRPLSAEAQEARARLAEMGVEASLSTAERRSLADAYYNGSRYSDAAEQYRILARSMEIDPGLRNTFATAEAACDWKLKRLTAAKAQALADTNDEAGARRSYLLMELARDRDSQADQRQIVSTMETRFPHSQWLAEALYSSGNMYLLKRDYASAANYYGEYALRFPSAKNGSLAHWKSGWLNYRLGQFDAATRIFDDQIRLYPAGPETVSALYWRGRLYETREHNAAMAAANYRAILRSSPHYFYAQMARQRLAALGTVPAVDEQRLSRFQPLPAPSLVESFPEASPHMAKARLLANAGLNDYVAKEIAADPNFGAASDLASAQIYASYGETFRALRIAKRAIPYSASAPVASIPLVYWRILYPEPYWQTIKAESAKNNLDPYLVASLMRQESEFDPTVVSYANAWGLMQLLPTTGKQMAKAEGMTKFQTFQLLDPATNIRLGTRYLKQMLDKFGGVQEYALAAYNAGDGRVADWESAGPYHSMDEFVESIPFTQTREYVQSILRNEEMYRAIDAYARTQGAQQSR